MIFNQTDSYWKERGALESARAICQQPESWKQTWELVKKHHKDIQSFIRPYLENKDARIVLTGEGSNEFVAQIALGYLNKKLGFKGRAASAAEVVESSRLFFDEDVPTLLVVLDETGNSASALAAIQTCNECCKNPQHLILTCALESRLAAYGKRHAACMTITLPHVLSEEGLPLSAAFTNLLLAVLLCFDAPSFFSEMVSCKDVFLHARDFLDHGYTRVEKWLEGGPYTKVVYLGANLLKGLSQAAAWKTSQFFGTAMSAAYGTPLTFAKKHASSLEDSTLVVVFVSDDTRQRKFDLEAVRYLAMEPGNFKLAVVCSHHSANLEELADYYYCFALGFPMENIFLAMDFIVLAQTLIFFQGIAAEQIPEKAGEDVMEEPLRKLELLSIDDIRQES